MPVCDAISGVDAMMDGCWLQGRAEAQQYRRRLLKDPGGDGIPGTSSWQPHLVCRQEGNLKNGRSRGEAHKKDGTPTVVYLADFTRFRVQWTRWGKGGPCRA
jgi:hypothetical protein